MAILAPKYHDLLWGVRRSIRYHSRRRMFFEQFNRVTNALGLIFGSATIFSVLSIFDSDLWTVIPAALVTLFSSLNLVLGTVGMAQLHHDLVRRFTNLEQDLVKTHEPNEQQIMEFSARRLQIEVDEPPVRRIVDILCHNELMIAEGYDPQTYPENYYEVGVLQRAFAHICDFGADKIKHGPKPHSSAC